MNYAPVKGVYDGYIRTEEDPAYEGMSKNEIILAIVSEIRQLNLPFPLTRYYMRIDELKASYAALLEYEAAFINKKHHELKGHPGKMWLPNKFRDSEIQLVTKENDWWIIDVIVDYFTEYARIRAKKDYAMSMQDVWNDDVILAKAVEDCLSKGIVDCKSLRVQMFFHGRELGLFRVTRAKSLVQTIMPGRDYSKSRWLDMSAGWGDRLLTACALNMDYLGFDPNTELIPGHGEIIDMFGDRTRQSVHYLPFETCSDIIENDVKSRGKFDISLISPPFYIIERYNGENQSVDTYPVFKDWLVKFLFKSLAMIWKNLKDEPGQEGYLAINIANIRNCDIVGPMQLFIEDMLPGSNWEGLLPFSGRGTKETPGLVYVWKKCRPESTPRRVLWNPAVKRSLRDCSPVVYRECINQKIP